MATRATLWLLMISFVAVCLAAGPAGARDTGEAFEDRFEAGGYDDNNLDDWFYDHYELDTDAADEEAAFGNGDDEGVDGLKEYYRGTFEEAIDGDDWFFDAYEPARDGGLWDF